MPNFLAPTDCLDQGSTIYSLLGTMWDSYEGTQQVSAFTRAWQELLLQTWQEQREVAACVSRFSIPIYHRQRWQPLEIQSTGALPDVRLVYTPNAECLGAWSSVTWATKTFDYLLPPNFVYVNFVLDKTNNPTIVWTLGVDFFLDPTRNCIRFVRDPFAQGFPTRPLYDGNGNLIGQELILWLKESDVDRSYAATQFGYAVNLPLPSGPNVMPLVNAVRDAETLGPCRDTLDRALAALCDAPLALTPNETVVDVSVDSSGPLIVTTANVYRCGAGATILVSIGQTLAQGQYLTDAFSVIDLTQGTPSATVVPSLALPTNYLLGAFSGPLTFSNSLQPLSVSTVAGRTYCTFPLGGATADVNLFFTQAQANGILPGGKTIAQMLDLRPQPQTTDPDANSLPAKVNPLYFLVQNVIRFGVVLIHTNTTSFGPNALGLGLLDKVMRAVLPPQGGYITF